MERKEFRGSPIRLAMDVSEWLGCDRHFILQSFTRDRDWSKPRYFELYNQRHATLICTTYKARGAYD